MSNGYTQITSRNVTNYPFGTKVRFDYGVGCGGEFGVIKEYRTTMWGTTLVAETDSGEMKNISGIATVGVGVYLV